MDETAYYVLLM